MSDSNSDIIDIPPENVVEHQTETKTSGEASKQRVGRSWQLGLAGVLIIAAAIGGAWVYRDLLSSYFPSDNVLALTQQVAALDEANKDIAKKLEAVVGVTDEIKSQAGAAQSAADEWRKELGTVKDVDAANIKAIAALQTSLDDSSLRLKVLEDKIAAAPASGSAVAVDTTVIEQRLAAVEKDLAALKAGSGNAVDTAALTQSLADLKGKIAEGSAFNDEYDRVRRSVPAADGLDVLEKFARQGVANIKTLQAQLKAVEAQLPKPEATSDVKDNSWSGWVTNLLSDVITIRDQGQPDWIVLSQKADAFLSAGDLAQASGVFENSPAPLPDGLKQWHEAAQARLQLDGALDKVSAAVLRQIAAKG
ncbi:MAG: hypothetical protein ABIN69_07665 [Aestuariivirga sp.]